jgi:glycosyltransferase involved in cell wall biosynthesis
VSEPAARVAVLLPVYNGAKWLGETLGALYAQTYNDYAIIAVDDCSTDSSYEILVRAAERDPQRVHVWRNESSQGVSGNWNCCLRMQRACLPKVDYILKVDQDDLPDKTLIETAVKVLDEDIQAVLCHFRLRLLADDGSEQCSPLADALRRHGWPLDVSHRMPAGEAIWLLIRYDNFIAGSGAVIRRTALESLENPFLNRSFQWASDHELWTRLATLGPLRYVAETGVYWRRHPENATAHTSLIRRRKENWLVVWWGLRHLIRKSSVTRVVSVLPSVGLRWLGSRMS